VLGQMNVVISSGAWSSGPGRMTAGVDRKVVLEAKEKASWPAGILGHLSRPNSKTRTRTGAGADESAW
jgi:hypothetical protein